MSLDDKWVELLSRAWKSDPCTTGLYFLETLKGITT